MSWSVPPTKRSYTCRGDYLASLRELRGWTQDDLAAAAGYSSRLIRKAEGAKSLSPDAIADLADALSTPVQPVYPEDLVSDPLAAARLFIESYHHHERQMLAHCRHVLAEDVVFWCAGDPAEMPLSGTYLGVAGFQVWLDKFFAMFTRAKTRPFRPTFAIAGNETVARYEESVVMDGITAPPVWIVQISKFQRGKMIRIENYFDTDTGQRFLSGVEVARGCSR